MSPILKKNYGKHEKEKVTFTLHLVNSFAVASTASVTVKGVPFIV
jgi:hypothetical protein